MKIAWGKRAGESFVRVALGVCRTLNWPETHINLLMTCMAFESGTSFSPSVRNGAGSGAVGLIQFMPSTALSLGTSTEKLEKMTAEGQLYYVMKYFSPYARNIHTLGDMYMAILMPKYVSAPQDARVFVSPSIQYRQNRGLDANADGCVTKNEIVARLQRTLTLGMEPGNVLEYNNDKLANMG